MVVLNKKPLASFYYRMKVLVSKKPCGEEDGGKTIFFYSCIVVMKDEI